MTSGRILYLGVFTGFAGGIERYAFQTAGLLRAQGWKVVWCGTRSERGEDLFRSGFDTVLSPDELLSSNQDYDLAVLHKVPALELLEKLRARFGERLVFLAHDHDLYCPRSYYYTPFGRINCHRAYSPFRCSLCARLTSPRKWKNLKRNPGRILRELAGHHAVVISAFMRDNLVRNGFSPDRVHLIPPVIAIPDAPRKSPEHTGFKIVFLGQLIRGKGADLLLDALRRMTVPWQAVIAGEGNDRPMLERLTSEYGIADKVRFTGWLDNPEECFKECDAAVFPSRWQEPFGLSGAEALAHGIPVVAFDVGGVREWLADSVSGFVVPEKDTAAMAKKLELLYHDRSLAERLGKAGRESVRSRFSPEQFTAALRKLLDSVTR